MGIFGLTGIWFLIGAILVWFMQAGFAMVETGFTRAKNAGNIIMKNLMDFCLGTIVFVLLGAGLMMGEDVLFGLVGLPNLGHFYRFCKLRLVGVFLQPRILRDDRDHRFGRDGRTYEIFVLLHLFLCDQRDRLSRRGALGVGRRMALQRNSGRDIH